MRHLAVSGLVLAVLAACSAPRSKSEQHVGEPARAAVIWNGFEHSWTYNHRLNRLGNYVALDCNAAARADDPRRRCRGEVVHTAASGTGADTASFESYRTRVVSEHAGFQTGVARLRVDGREERELRVEHEVRLQAEGRLRNRDNYAVVLNGFDLYADGPRARAKKPQHVRLWTDGEAEHDGSNGQLTFEVGAVLNLNCDSIECKQQSNRVRYAVDLRFLVIGFDDDVRRTPRSFEVSYAWTKRTELRRSDVKLNREDHRIKGAAGEFGAAALGFREIDFRFGKKGRPKDHWFVAWVSSLRKLEYDPATGRARFDLDLFFKEWNRKAKRKLTSIARRGEATLRADVALLQFRDARLEQKQSSGELRWPGRNRSATSDAALWREEFEWGF